MKRKGVKMKKLKYILLGAVSCVFLTGCAVHIHYGRTRELSGDEKTIKKEAESNAYKEYSLDMDELLMQSSDLIVTIEPSDKAYIELTYSDDLEDYGFYANIEHDEIKIGTTSKKKFRDPNFRAVIHANVSECHFAGKYKAEWKCIPCNKVELGMSGAVNCDIQDLDCKNLDVTTNGASRLSMSGKAGDAEVVLNGASEYEAKELLCNNIKAELNGASMMKISVTDLLDVEVNGAGEVSYYGSPEVKSDVHGAGKVKQKSEDPYC